MRGCRTGRFDTRRGGRYDDERVVVLIIHLHATQPTGIRHAFLCPEPPPLTHQRPQINPSSSSRVHIAIDKRGHLRNGTILGASATSASGKGRAEGM